jgi:hypothetical protein
MTRRIWLLLIIGAVVAALVPWVQEKYRDAARSMPREM